MFRIRVKESEKLTVRVRVHGKVTERVRVRVLSRVRVRVWVKIRVRVRVRVLGRVSKRAHLPGGPISECPRGRDPWQDREVQRGHIVIIFNRPKIIRTEDRVPVIRRDSGDNGKDDRLVQTRTTIIIG